MKALETKLLEPPQSKESEMLVLGCMLTNSNALSIGADKLQETDFYSLSDVTMPNDMKTYRQELRDLPANTADPADVTWPTKPS